MRGFLISQTGGGTRDAEDTRDSGQSGSTDYEKIQNTKVQQPEISMFCG